MEGSSRIRLVFDDLKILSKSQRSRGMSQSWLLLNPNIATISDLASHVCRLFKLKRFCPNDLLLSMDDFILPPFESTYILKDKDIIRVRKKEGTHMDAIEFDVNPHYIHNSGVEENGHTISSDKLLATLEFEDDAGQHKRRRAKNLCAHNETANHTGSPLKPRNKRKHSDEIQGSKKKKLKASCNKPLVSSDKDEDTAEELVRLRNGLASSKKKSCSPKSSNKKDKPSTSSKRPDTLVNSQYENNFDPVSCSSKRGKSKQKNLQLVSFENAIISTSIAGDIPAEQNHGSFQQTDNSAKRMRKKDRHKDGKSDALFASQPDDFKQPNSVLMEERSVQAEDNIGGNACQPHGNDSGIKVQSRSARRKKAKRQWAREMKAQQAQDTQPQAPPDINPREAPEQQKTGPDTEMEKEIVPLVIRPGHIRFQSLDEEQSQWQSETQETVETLQWKGTTSKKKGQKWGQETGGNKWIEANGYEAEYNSEENVGNCNKANGYKEQYNMKENGDKWNNARDNKKQYNRNEKTMSTWNERSNVQNFGNNANCHNEQYNGKLKIPSNMNDPVCHDEQCNGKEKSMSKWNDANGCEKQCDTKANECIDANSSDDHSNRKAISEKGKAGSGLLDFDSLLPLTRTPQVGDVLAYRLIELSSSWCPEVSSFRVGQVTSYDCLSMSIVLVPVPEYPIFTDEDVEERDPILEANSSQYNEDGSLQIHYPSLVDVRLFKESDSAATISQREMAPQEAAPENNCEPAVMDSNASHTVAQPTEGISGWDEIRQALNEKKKELLKKDGQKESTPRNSSACAAWSYKALRRSALGPVLAYLRENDDKASL